MPVMQDGARGEKDAGGGEASFRSLKYTVGLLHFHAKKKGTDCNAIQRPTSSDMDNTDRAKTVQKPCSHGLQNKKAMKSFDFTAFSGASSDTALFENHRSTICF